MAKTTAHQRLIFKALKPVLAHHQSSKTNRSLTQYYQSLYPVPLNELFMYRKSPNFDHLLNFRQFPTNMEAHSFFLFSKYEIICLFTISIIKNGDIYFKKSRLEPCSNSDQWPLHLFSSCWRKNCETDSYSAKKIYLWKLICSKFFLLNVNNEVNNLKKDAYPPSPHNQNYIKLDMFWNCKNTHKDISHA
jgi:hypothetical protein